MLRRIGRAVLNGITSGIRRRPGFFAVLGATVVFSTVLVKDNIAEAIRSNIQAVEFAKQFYELHIEDIELNTRLNEVGGSVDEIKLLLSNKGVSNALQETINRAIQNYDDTVKDMKLVQAANADTEELLKHVSDSVFFFTYSEGDEGILRSDVKLLNHGLEALASDIKRLKDKWNEANRLVSVPNHQFTPAEMAKVEEAYKTLSDDAESAAIQAVHLEMQSREDRVRAVKVAELYRQYLEEEDDSCKWAIIILIVVGSAIGVLSQLAGVKAVETP